LHPADVAVDWTVPALAIDRLIRAATTSPGAWTTYSDQRLGLGPVQLVADDDSLQPGQLAVLKNELRVGTGSHAVRLGEVKPSGKRAMPAADWARGARLDESVVFG
jgi:methionyl-tRNA formyltransferase